MATYLKTSDGRSAPIKLGSFINPASVNFTTTSTYRGQNAYGGSVAGTNLFAWIKTYYPADWAGLFGCWNITQGQSSVTYTGSQHALIGGGYIQFSAWGTWYSSGVRPFELGLGVTVKPEISNSPYNSLAMTQWFMYRERISGETHDSFISALQSGGINAYLVAYPNDGETVEHVGIVFKNSYYTGYEDQYYNWHNSTTTPAYWRSLLGAAKPSDGPDSQPDGEWGDFNDETETIGLPGVPSISALDTGFVRMYNPTAQELQQFASFIWSTKFFTNVIKNFSDPMQAIVSLAISPVAPTVAQEETNIVVGNLPAFTEQESTITPIMAAPLTNQYVTVDCGSITLNEYWGSALDYSPYSKCEIYLPYIGVQNLSIDDVMGSTLTLRYNVDLLTGICTAVLKCVKSAHMEFDAALYHWSGNMMSNLPISGSNFAQVITALTASIVSAGIPIVTGAGGAAIASGVVGGVMNMMNAKAQVQKSGSISMQSGSLDNQTPYLILTRPIQSKAANYPAYKGWTTNITAEIGSLTGYTEVEYVHVEVAGATDEERNEIERLLKAGVII